MNTLINERKYLIIRKLLFWLFTAGFVICTPIVLFYSLGYKFDHSSKKFLKTGAVAIKTYPRGAKVLVNGTFKETTPCVIRELLPKQYSFSLEKEGFYSYTVPLEIKSDAISSIDLVLVPQSTTVEKMKFDFDVYKFFVSKNLWNSVLIGFTSSGVYLFEPDFSESKKITSQVLDKDLAGSLLGFRLENNRLVFWNKNTIWMLDIPGINHRTESSLKVAYKTQEGIVDVFVGLKERYLIVHSGLKIEAVDLDNPKGVFNLYDLESLTAQVFYDSRYEDLFIKDKIPGQDSSSLFKIRLAPVFPSIEQKIKSRFYEQTK